MDFNKKRMPQQNLKNHKDTQIIIKKIVHVFFTQYKNERKEREFWRQKDQQK